MAETQKPQVDVLADVEAHTPETLHPILEAAYTYRKQLIIGVSVIVAVAAVYAGVNAYTARSKASAQADLGAILVEAKGADKIAKLEELLGGVPGSVKPAVAVALADACMEQRDYAKAAKYWDRVATEASGDTQFAAKLGRAKALLLSGKADDALTALKALAGDASEAYMVPVTRQLAVAAEAAGNKAEALAAYKKLAEKKTNDKPFVDYKISQLESE